MCGCCHHHHVNPSHPNSIRNQYSSRVTKGLIRYYGTRHLHFITCSCYRRQPQLHTASRRNLFLKILEQARRKYRFVVHGYVLMPEHFHLLITEPEVGDPSVVMKVVKERFTRQLNQHRKPPSAQTALWDSTLDSVWQKRFYDFNVRTRRKSVEKLKYIHRNPVVRGLVTRPEDWPWSSFRHYAMGEIGPVEIESEWTALRPEREVHVMDMSGALGSRRDLWR